MKQVRFVNEIIFLAVFIVSGLTFAAIPSGAWAHTSEDEVLKGVGVDERLNARVSPDLEFTNQEGRKVKLGEYFTGQPVILTLNYYSCPHVVPAHFPEPYRNHEQDKGAFA
jgi:cytochrome oxidase Cu insertion factor (SCO1/SenC/PrrC family)